MGILEEAVQANAGLLARETAKRCAEQALQSVEAASVTETHSLSLAKFLAPACPEEVLQFGLRPSRSSSEDATRSPAASACSGSNMGSIGDMTQMATSAMGSPVPS